MTPFTSVAKVPLVKFFFDLAAGGWDQGRLTPPCPRCAAGQMRITYDFPRSVDEVRLSVVHIVGLNDKLPGYLPMLWEAQPRGETEPWFDFKYVGYRADRGYQSYGLARPAVFSRPDLRRLFEAYHRVTGHDVLGLYPAAG